MNENLVNEVPGRLSAAAIRRVVAAHESEVRGCYAHEATSAPSLQGALVVSWEVMIDGTVLAPMVTRATFDDPPLEQCVLNRLRTWRFPVSESQTFVDAVRFEFPQ